MPEAKYVVLGAGRFRKFQVQSELGNKSFKTYQEAEEYIRDIDVVSLGKYIVTVTDTTIIDRDGIRVNEIPQ